jgi:hypothetical protein
MAALVQQYLAPTGGAWTEGERGVKTTLHSPAQQQQQQQEQEQER